MSSVSYTTSIGEIKTELVRLLDMIEGEPNQAMATLVVSRRQDREEDELEIMVHIETKAVVTMKGIE